MPLVTDGDITKGWIRDRRLLRLIFSRLVPSRSSSSPLGRSTMEIPEPVYNYAKKISGVTGLPLEQVLKSKPVRRMIERWTKYVRVEL